MNSIPKYSVINFDDKIEVFKTNGVITSVRIFDKIYKTIPEEDIIDDFRKNGYTRFIYLTLRHKLRKNSNAIDEFFYIGQHGSNSIKHITSYFGSGRILRNIVKVHPNELEKCYLFRCSSKDEMNKIEHEIVDNRLISIKPYCLNLMCGGFSTSWKDGKTKEELRRISENKSKGMRAAIKSNPEWVQRRTKSMTETKRSKEYREKAKNFFKNWRDKNPEFDKTVRLKAGRTFSENHTLSVSMYDMDGNIIKSFNTISECSNYISKELNLSQQIYLINRKISKCVHDKLTIAYNRQFKHFDGEQPKNIPKAII